MVRIEQGKIIDQRAGLRRGSVCCGAFEQDDIARRVAQWLQVEVMNSLAICAFDARAQVATAAHHAAIGGLQTVQVQIVRQGGVQAGRGLLCQHSGGLSIIQHDLVRGAGHDRRDGNIGEQGGETLLFGFQMLGFPGDGFGRGERGLTQLPREPLCCRGKVAKVARAMGVQLAVDACMGAGAHGCRQLLDGFGDVFVEQQPDRGA